MNHRKTITLGDALKYKSVAYSTMIKPIGSLCNMDCHYCYYLDKKRFYPTAPARMTDEVLELYVRTYIQSNQADVITFAWHGGEPLLAGVDFYRKAIAYQQQYKGSKQIDNVLQSNGLFIDREWCAFFKEHNFLIGISIDGPKEVHDAYRIDKGGKPTFDRVMESFRLLTEAGVECNALAAVHRKSEGRGKEIYLFLKSLGVRFIQFLPVLEQVIPAEAGERACVVPPGTEQAQLAEWSVSAKGFGTFMTEIFDYWVINDVGRCYVQLFDVSLAQWAGAPPGLCSFEETCGSALVVEHNGDVYCCDHFVYPQMRLGNIRQTSLLEMLQSKQQFGFGVSKRNALPRQCLACNYYFACRGECPKHRFNLTSDGSPGLNALCEGYKLFFEHVDPYMRYMKACLDNGLPPAMVMRWARERAGYTG